MVNLKGDAEKGLGGLGSSLKSLGGVALGVAAGGIAAIGATLISSIGDARESAKIFAQTEAVIKSTGGAAGVSAQQVADYASSLSAASGKSLFGDEQIAQSENLLLTFTSIKGKALEAATAMSVDMAQAMGGEPKDAAIQLGKALNDPIKGITALSRVGVAFTAEQKAQIKAMQEAGDMAGAQAIILKELNTEFGGSALAAAKADGGVAQFWDSIGEAKEKLGAVFLPMLTQAFGYLSTNVIPVVEQAATAIGAWLNDPATQAGIASLTSAIGGGLSTAFAFITDTLIPALVAGWNLLQPPIAMVIGWLQAAIPAAIALLAGYWNTVLLPIFTALVKLYNEHIEPALTKLVGWLAERLPPAIAALSAYWTTTLQPAIAIVVKYLTDTVIPMIGVLFDWLSVNLPIGIQLVSDYWNTTLWPALQKVASFINDKVIPVLTTIALWLGVNLPPVIKVLADFWLNTLLPAMLAVFNFTNDKIIPVLMTIATWLGTNIPPAIDTAVKMWEILKVSLASFKETYIDPVVRGFERVMEVVGSVRAKIDEFVALLPTVQIPDWLRGHSPPPLANWLSAVADAANDVTGAASGIKLPGLGGALPAGGGAGFAPSGGGGVTITVGQIVVQGSADADKTAEAVRAKLLELGKRNLNIFGGLA